MNLSNLTYAKGSHKKAKRVGRGEGSGHGGTSTRGHKGQYSRSGSKRRPWFEGGQMPLQRRIPKRGFNNIFRTVYQSINLERLNKLDGIAQITPEVLLEKRLIRKKNVPIKVLGTGEISRAVEVHAHGFSRSAQEKIEKAGGKAIVIQPPAAGSAKTGQ
ncbi:50S ribosomal protein L15 [candidate division KSB1 bacterium]|nr:MAG: 50S ribosomal protein L15 [candidate division KSB1 bacterium]MBC6947865.1 50S ribosomal protein L15 [candidate division KSB1 bacterium]MCE7942287.1 50S ribosomal protein L15 [Chlorobi bacterium CHB1]NUM72987.1 50S ribosomal protein L15 [candidate division KSB1 bacterium]